MMKKRRRKNEFNQRTNRHPYLAATATACADCDPKPHFRWHLLNTVWREWTCWIFAAPLGGFASSEATRGLVDRIQSIFSTKSPLDVTSTAACDHNPRYAATVKASVELIPFFTFSKIYSEIILIGFQNFRRSTKTMKWNPEVFKEERYK
jgi:hypothetical protein